MMTGKDLGFIHKFIAKNSNGQTLLLLHGTGGNEDDLIPLAHEIAPNFSILSPRGKVLENGMARFFRRVREGVFDLEDLRFRTDELAEFAISASSKYGFNLNKLVALGYSNGANIAASMLLLRPDSLAGAILFRAMLPLFPEKIPDLSSKYVFLSSGKYDHVIPKESTEELFHLLKKAGAKVEINWIAADHGLTEAEIKQAGNWLRAREL